MNLKRQWGIHPEEHGFWRQYHFNWWDLRKWPPVSTISKAAERSSRGTRPVTPSFVLPFLKDELGILIFTSPAWRHLIKIKISWVICGGGLVEREQRVDEIEGKVSSLSTVTASCLSLRPRRAAEDCGAHFEAWCVAVGQFYKVIKGERKEEWAITSPRPDSAEESGQPGPNKKPSLRVQKKNQREITSPALHDACCPT